MKTGALASDIDKAARDIISAYGYGEYFDHGLGHGLESVMDVNFL